MDFAPGNTSLCLVFRESTGNTSLFAISNCGDCEEQFGSSNQVPHNLTHSTNCTQCLQNVCTEFTTKKNWYRSQSMLPVAAFMGILMLLGILGNTIVLVVYYFKDKKTTANKFMMALAGIDLNTCLVIHPYVISKLFRFYSPTTWVCKIFEYLLYVSQASQGLMLTAVAIDRYFAIFKPLAISYMENAAYMIPMCIAIPTGLSIPMILFYGDKTIWLYDQSSQVHIRTHVCHYSDEYDGSRDQFVFVISSLAALLVILTVISILYVFIGVKIRKRYAQVNPLVQSMVSLPNNTTNRMNEQPVERSDADPRAYPEESPENWSVRYHHKHEERVSKRRLRESTTTTLDMDTTTVHDEDHHVEESHGRVRKSTSTSSESTLHDLMSRSTVTDPIRALNVQPMVHCSTMTPPIQNTLYTITVLPLSKSLNVPISVHDRHTRAHLTPVVQKSNKKPAGLKGCKLLFIVTMVFFFSWLPFWVLRFVTTPEDLWEKINPTTSFLNHLFFLNNAVNPILYTFINKKFREQCILAKKKITTRLRYMCC